MILESLERNFFHGKTFPRNKLALRPFCSADSTTQNTPTIQELIRKQHWSKLSTHLKTTNPTSLLQQLFDSGADPKLILGFVGNEERSTPSDAMDILCDPEWQINECYDDKNTPCRESLPF
ncbi:hypothetical protein ACOSQ2_030650 [Xanthoceras sorbifolium]